MYERGVHFGNTMLSGKQDDLNYFKSKFFENTIKLIKDIFLEEDAEIKDHLNALPQPRIEDYLKWLFFYCIESENVIVINNFLKIILDIYTTCN